MDLVIPYAAFLAVAADRLGRPPKASEPLSSTPSANPIAGRPIRC